MGCRIVVLLAFAVCPLVDEAISKILLVLEGLLQRRGVAVVHHRDKDTGSGM